MDVTACADCERMLLTDDAVELHRACGCRLVRLRLLEDGDKARVTVVPAEAEIPCEGGAR